MFAILMACVYEVDSCVRGYHVYQDIWTPLVGEEVDCKREEENIRDRYKVGVACHATTGPPKIGPPGPFTAAAACPPGPFAALQVVPPDHLWCHSWSHSATVGPLVIWHCFSALLVV